MKYLSQILKDEIREKDRLVRTCYSTHSIAKYQKLAEKSIEKNAQIHSYRIEHPEFHIQFSVPRNKNRKFIKEGIKNIENAFKWGTKNFDTNNFNESLIREIAIRVTPEIYNGENATYRDRGTAIKGASVTPPYPEKLITCEIPWFEESLREQLTCPDIVNRIETAIFAHLHIARIHPFVDGNGRTARILQDVILNHSGIPTPIIEAGERITYYEILDKAVLDWKNEKGDRKKHSGATKGEESFYNFIAGKINMSYDKLLETCQKFH